MRWNIDAGHSAVEFGVRHLGISTVKGRFQKFEGAVETDAAGVPTGIAVTIDTASIDTNVADRDAHLRSPDFFSAAEYPTIAYRSTAVRSLGGEAYEIAGELTMRGVSRPVTFRAAAGAAVLDPWGNRRIAGEATGKLNRKEWGLTWNQVLEAGGLMVGEDVKFTLDIEVVAERAAAAA